MNDLFRRAASKASQVVGSSRAFIVVAAIVLIWAASGPIFNFSDTWQLVINTGTTIITFLMVFLIQNSQNRDSKALHLKLDELIRAMKGARNDMINLEYMSDAELSALQEQFRQLERKHSPLVSDDIATISGEIQRRRSQRAKHRSHNHNEH